MTFHTAAAAAVTIPHTQHDLKDTKSINQLHKSITALWAVPSYTAW